MKAQVLNNGITIPQLGIGGFAQSKENILDALETGYRLIDTAAQYGNEDAVGFAIKESGIDRKEIFLTTKLWTEDIRQGRTREAFFDSLKRLQTEYVDLYLIHWPAVGFEKAWVEMTRLYQEGYIRAVGVSNFHLHHLDELKKVSDIVPAVNQIESHPYFHNQELIDCCREREIAVEAWCPLGGAGGHLLEDKTLAALAEKYKKTAAQLVIRWHLQRGIILFPKSSHRERMQLNQQVFDFTLAEKDMEEIYKLDRRKRIGANPDNFNF